MQELINLTSDLIRFKSMHSNPREISACVDFIGAWLNRWNIPFKRIEKNGVPSIMVLPGETYAKILLMSHIDVVDAPDRLFEPYLEDGNLFGRGSLDDKYAAAISLYLVKNRVEKNRAEGRADTDMPFGLLITGDEEIGGVNGAKHILEQIRTDFCIALDGGDLSNIVVKEKGVLGIKLVSRGKTAHGSRPWLGENAIEKLFADYQKVKLLFQDTTPDHWNKTINFSVIHAGKSSNQVPDSAEALFDIRFTENDDVDTLIETIRNTVSGEIFIEAKGHVFKTEETPFLDILLSVTEGTRTGFEHGASDARYLSEFGMNGIVWGASGDNSCHADDEHVNIDSMVSLTNILNSFFDRVEKDV